MDYTQKLKINNMEKLKTNNPDILVEVYEALKEKGYNPINQLVGYILSGEPTYITNHNGARAKMNKIERDELLEMLVNDYLQHRLGK